MLKNKLLKNLPADLFCEDYPLGYLCVMRILIDGGSLREDRLNAEKTEIIFRCLHILTKKQVDTDWLLLAEGSHPLKGLSALQVERVTVTRPFGGILGQKFGYHRRILSGVRQSGATHLLSFDGAGIPGLQIPQCNLVFTFSEQEKKEWIGKNGARAGKRPVTGKPVLLYGGPEEGIVPIPWVEREKAKISFAAGKEYFLLFFTGLSSFDLVGLLKAFSLFKKRQQSNMQLVFAGTGEPDGDFREKLKTYKYREDVHIRENLSPSSAVPLVAAAYALLSPFTREATGLPLFRAFQSGVPVVISGVPVMASGVLPVAAAAGKVEAAGCQVEIAGEAALYTGPDDITGLADRMMSLYKDENLRNSLIAKGQSRLSFFGWEASAQEIWKEIQNP